MAIPLVIPALRETGGCGVKDPQLHSKLKASLGYMRPCLRNKDKRVAGNTSDPVSGELKATVGARTGSGRPKLAKTQLFSS